MTEFDSASSEINYGRNSESGTVHVMVPDPEFDMPGGRVVVNMLGIVHTLCGIVSVSAKIHGTVHFEDAVICGSCHRMMGDHAVRLFEERE